MIAMMRGSPFAQTWAQLNMLANQLGRPLDVNVPLACGYSSIHFD